MKSNKFKIKNILILILSVIAISFYSSLTSQELPREGVVTSIEGRNVAVRTGPPKASAFSYELEPKFYSIGVGSIFTAVDRVDVINGEIWYQIRISKDKIVNPRVYDKTKVVSDTITGWMVGKLKTKWLVSFDPNRISYFSSKSEAELDKSKKNVDEASSNIFMNYLLIILGALLGLWFSLVKRYDALFSKKWFRFPYIFEASIILLANFLFMYVMLDFVAQEYNDALNAKQAFQTTFVIKIIAIFSKFTFGFLILGFILSILLLKFLYFTKEYFEIK